MNIAGLKFDSDSNPIEPVIVLATRSGEKIGVIKKTAFRCKGNLSSADEISFSVHKDTVPQEIWNGLKDFRLCWIRDWDAYFEINVTVEDGDSLVKNVTGVSLGEAELSQTNLYGVEINTEEEITNSGRDYSPTVFYNKSDTKHSLLHRMLSRTCYKPGTVQDCLWKEQRSFSFNDRSIKDGFDEVAKELKCLFIYRNDTDTDGKINRVVDVYNLDEERKNDDGTFASVYGDDTGIFISDENIAKTITLTTNIGNVKNCFRLEGGDEVMTAAIAGCNPAGTSYLWYITDDMKETMSEGLVNALDDYDTHYKKITENDIVLAYNNFILFGYYSSYLGVIEDIAGEPYSAEKSYSVGDRVNHDGSAYRCKAAVSAGEKWNDEKWEYVYGEHNAIFTGVKNKKITAYDLGDTSDRKYPVGEFVFIATKEEGDLFWQVTVYECIRYFCYTEIPSSGRPANHPVNFPDYWREREDLSFTGFLPAEYYYYVYAESVTDLTEYLYNAIDVSSFISDAMMPDYNIMEMNQDYLDASLAETINWFLENAVGINESDPSKITPEIVTRAVDGMIKSIVDSRISIDIKDMTEDPETHKWSCALNASAVNTDGQSIDATSSCIITTTELDDAYIRQKIEKALSKKTDKERKEALAEMEAYKGVHTQGGNYRKDDITWYDGKMYRCISEDEIAADTEIPQATDWEIFDARIGYYSVAELQAMYDSCDGCLAILTEQGADGTGSGAVNDYYEKYRAVMQALLVQKEWRETQLKTIRTVKGFIQKTAESTHNSLNMEKYIGEDNMEELLSYRRESTYSNSNFISDGLTNRELIKRASLFFDDAVKEIYQSAERQHSISSSIHNLLAIKEFSPVKDQFVLGNWIREKIDGTVYKLRLIGYELNFEDMTALTVEFSDMVKAGDSVSDIKSILDRAKSVASTYGYTSRQADRGSAAGDAVEEMNKNGIDVDNIGLFGPDKSIMWTQGGFILREYDELTDTYSPNQLKILSTGIYRTTDGWKTVTKII